MELVAFICQPDFPHTLQTFIHEQNHPGSDPLVSLDKSFDCPIRVFHSAKVEFYTPSDLCEAAGMH